MGYIITNLRSEYANRQTGNREIIASVVCDDAASLPVQRADQTFVLSSDALDISTGDKYIINSSGEWVKQPTAKAWENVYTQAEVNALLAQYSDTASTLEMILSNAFGNAGASLDGEVADIDTIIQPGTYRITSGAAASQIAHVPIQQAGKLVVITTSFASRLAQIYFPVSISYGLFVRSYIATGWQPWYKFEGVLQA